MNHLQSNCVIPERESDPAFNAICKVLLLLAARSTVRFFLSRTACYSNCLSSILWKPYHLNFQQSVIFHLPKPHRFLLSTYVHTALPVVSWPFHSILKHLGCLHKIKLKYVMSLPAKRYKPHLIWGSSQTRLQMCISNLKLQWIFQIIHIMERV